MRKFLGLLLVPFFCLIFLTSVTHAHADTLINVTNIVWSSCSPDCRSLRIYYDNFPAQGMGLLNVDANSGAYGATSFTTTYADFNIPNNNPPWDYNMELTSSNGGVSRVIHLIPSFTGDAFNSQFASAVINQGDTWSYTGSFTPADYSTSWTATVDYGDGSGSQPLTLTGTNFTLSHQFTTRGTFTVNVSVTDNQGTTGIGSARVEVPTINVTSIVWSSCSPNCQKLRIYFDNFSAPDMGLINVDSHGNFISGAYGATSFTTTYADFNIPNNNLPWDVNMQLVSSNGGVSRLLNLVPPTVNSISDVTINEGDTYTATGSFTNSNANASSWTATVDYGDGGGAQSLTLNPDKTFSLSHLYKDNQTNNAPYTLTVAVTDNQGEIGFGTAQVTVNNVAPTPGAITAPSSPVQVNTAMTASANFTDPGVLDTHTASWNWGDGNTTTGTVTETNGSGSVSNNHTYTATGVYTITLTVTDKDGGVGTSTFQYVSVYDSNSSFAGGRSFDNPSTASPSTAGKVTFGISAKYNNSNVLTGNAKMNFKAASLDFASTFLSSLATSNGKAYLKGTGTLNGTSGYTFLATGIDGSVAGGNDLIRFQIIDSSNNVVYDSQPGAGDTTDPTTLDATGNIRVH